MSEQRKRATQFVPKWKSQARKAKNISENKSYSSGGLPRKYKPTKVSLPKVSFLEKEIV